MKIHEYQAKSILKNHGVAIPRGIAIKSMDEFDNAIDELKKEGATGFVVKAQIHAGGRGKGIIYNKDNRNEVVVEGGVKYFGDKIDEAKEYSRKVLGNILVTRQTGSEGKEVPCTCHRPQRFRWMNRL